jgi:hypothetical protein
MTAADARKPAPITKEDVFRERCEARAILYAACEYDLHEAVDVLQADAERSGLIAEIGQDAVQTIMATAFRAVRDTQEPPTKVPEDIREVENDQHVATSTIQAVEYLIKQNDPKRLGAWLAKHTRVERSAIKKYLGAKR